MARMIHNDAVIAITRKQLKSLLNETTDITPATSVGYDVTEYTLRNLSGDPMIVLVTGKALTEHDLICTKAAELIAAERTAEGSAR